MKARQIPFDIVVGQSINRGIGINNSLPWKLPRDLKMFKKITTSGN
jgi:dihydrofolate reductase